MSFDIRSKFADPDVRAKSLLAWTCVLLALFFAAQPFSRNLTMDATVALAVTGLFFIPGMYKRREFHRHDVVLLTACIAVPVVTLLAWFASAYFDGGFAPLKIESRFLLLPLALLAFYRAGLTLPTLTAALLIGSVSYAYLTWQWPAHGRVSGDENAVTFGNGAFLLSAISAALVLTHKHRIWQLLALASAAGYAYTAYRSGTRGSFLAVPCLGLLLFWVASKPQKIILMVVAFALAIGFTQTSLYDGFKRGFDGFSRYMEHNNAGGSTGQRLEQWQAAWCFFKEDPILGKGPHQFQQAIQDEARTCDIRVTNHKGYYSQAHSYYFNTLATQGLLGLLAGLVFFAIVCWYAYRTQHPARFLVYTAVISMLAYGITVDLFFHRYNVDKHLLLLAALLAICLHPRAQTQKEASPCA